MIAFSDERNLTAFLNLSASGVGSAGSRNEMLQNCAWNKFPRVDAIDAEEEDEGMIWIQLKSTVPLVFAAIPILIALRSDQTILAVILSLVVVEVTEQAAFSLMGTPMRPESIAIHALTLGLVGLSFPSPRVAPEAQVEEVIIAVQ
jgi:hypothetical protein